MGWVRVSREEFARIKAMAAARKAKREEKRKTMPWGEASEGHRPPTDAEKKAHLDSLKPRRPRRKKSPIELQEAKNDALWSLAIRRRDREAYGPLCRICHRTEADCGYHLVPKKRGRAIRWLLENGVAGCSPCNFGERNHPGLYREKHVSLVGKEVIETIEARARKAVKLTLEDLRAVGAWLKAVIERGPGQPAPEPPACYPAL